MRITCIGGGPAGLYFGPADEEARSAPRRQRASSATGPYDTFGWGVVFSDQTLGNLRAADPETRARRSSARSTTGTTSTFISRAARSRSGGHGFCGIGRKRLLEHPAGALRGARRRAACSRPRSPTTSAFGRRPDRRLRRHQQPHPQQVRRRLPARHRRRASAASSGSARSKLFDAFTFAFEETDHGAGSRRTPTSSTATRRPSSSRRPRTCGARPGLDRMSRRKAIAFCERCSRKYLDGHALMSNAAPPARLGAVDPLPARRLPAPGCTGTTARRPRAGRADGRRRAHRAFLDRLGHQARAGGRHRARATASARARQTCVPALAAYEADALASRC